MALENPNFEIDDNEKQLFAGAIERLLPFTVIDTPHLIDEVDDGVVILEKGGVFNFSGTEFEIESSEAISYEGERISIGHSVTTRSVVAIEGLVLARTTSYSADWYSGLMDWHDENSPYWRTEYDSQDTQQVPGEEPIVVMGDYELEMKAFYEKKPSMEEIEARREAIRLEESDSESLLPYRFTRARFRQIMPPLQLLGPEHFIKAA